MAPGEFAKEVGASKHKRILLVLDQAGWHTSGEIEVPEGIHLEFLPTGSPELQPAERLWPLTNEAIANRPFEGISEIILPAAARLIARFGTRPRRTGVFR